MTKLIVGRSTDGVLDENIVVRFKDIVLSIVLFSLLIALLTTSFWCFRFIFYTLGVLLRTECIPQDYVRLNTIPVANDTCFVRDFQVFCARYAYTEVTYLMIFLFYST